MKWLFHVGAFMLSATLAAPAIAQDFNAGLEAAIAEDYVTALENWAPLAEQGNADAQNNLGLMYSNGRGVPQDYGEAVKWYRLAAEQGDARAQANLGIMHENGQGVPQDLVLAHMWTNISSANGEQSASERRTKLEALMTRDQIANAQARARVCMASGYQDCD
jgi:TPR repeat protein